MSRHDHLEERLRRSDPAPPEAQLPESMWDAATLFDAVDRRSGDRPTREENDAGSTPPTAKQPTQRRWRGPLVAVGAAVVTLLIAGVTALLLRPPAVLDPSGTTPATSMSSCLQVPDDAEYDDILDGMIGRYTAGRYRVDQVNPITHFTLEHSWHISDLNFGEPHDVGFSGLRPVDVSAERTADPFVEIWSATSWCDVTTNTSVVFEPGELAAAIQADVRFEAVSVSGATVGSCGATRIDASVREEYLHDSFWLGNGASRELGDIAGCEAGNTISHAGPASERVVFWAVNVDGIDLLISATYPPEATDEFEPMLQNLVDSIEFEPSP